MRQSCMTDSLLCVTQQAKHLAGPDYEAFHGIKMKYYEAPTHSPLQYCKSADRCKITQAQKQLDAADSKKKGTECSDPVD